MVLAFNINELTALRIFVHRHPHNDDWDLPIHEEIERGFELIEREPEHVVKIVVTYD